MGGCRSGRFWILKLEGRRGSLGCVVGGVGAILLGFLDVWNAVKKLKSVAVVVLEVRLESSLNHS